MTKRDNTRYGIGCLAILLLLIAGILALPKVTPEEQAPTEPKAAIKPTPTPAPSDADLAAAAAEANRVFPPEVLPRGAPEPPIAGMCINMECARYRVTIKNRDWPRAWRGDYQGQRNVAFCLSTGCNGAVTIGRAEACAWRSVILSINPKVADDTDAANLRNDCGKLDAAGAELAKEKVAAILDQLGASQ